MEKETKTQKSNIPTIIRTYCSGMKLKYLGFNLSGNVLIKFKSKKNVMHNFVINKEIIEHYLIDLKKLNFTANKDKHKLIGKLVKGGLDGENINKNEYYTQKERRTTKKFPL